MLSVEQMKKVCELRAKINERVPVMPISVGEAKDALVNCEWDVEAAEKMLKTKHGILDDYGNWEITLDRTMPPDIITHTSEVGFAPPYRRYVVKITPDAQAEERVTKIMEKLLSNLCAQDIVWPTTHECEG
jgi:hypothetical protein